MTVAQVVFRGCTQLLCVVAWCCLLQSTDAMYSDYVIWAVLGGAGVIFNGWSEIKRRTEPPLGMCLVSCGTAVLFMIAIGLSEFTSLCKNGIPQKYGVYLIVLLGSLIVMWNIAMMVLRLSERWHVVDGAMAYSGKKLVIVFSLLPIVYCLFLFIAEYPGLMSGDSYMQMREAMGLWPLSNHHPVFHTLMIRLAYKLGMLFRGSVSVVVALYSIGQILFLSIMVLYAVAVLSKRGVAFKIIGLIIVWYAIHPVHLFYSVTMWKNVVFGGASLMMTVSLSELIRQRSCRAIHMFGFIVGSILFCLMLTNGFAAYFLFLLVCVPYFLKKGYRRIACVAFSCWVFAFVCRGPVATAAGVRSMPVSVLEPLAVPMQQVARVVVEGGKMSDSEVNLISLILSPEKIVQAYLPTHYGPIKDAVRKRLGTFKERKLEYLILWLKLGVRHPGAYIRAWVDLTRGYWSAGCRPRWANLAVDVASFPGIELSTLINKSRCHEMMKQYAFAFEGWTGIGVLKSVESIGLHLWLLIIAFGVCIYRREPLWILWVPQFAVIVTLMLSTPLNHEVRYAYSLFSCFPFLVCVPWLRRSTSDLTR